MKNIARKIGVAAILIAGGSGAQQSLAQGGFQLPKYEKTTLKNGLTVYLMEQKEVPLVHISAVFDAGAIYDGPKAGLAAFTADALLYGTQKYTKAQIEEELDFVGASISARSDHDLSKLSMSFMKRDSEKMLDIFSETLTRPVFDAKEFEKEKTRRSASLDQQKESPRNVLPSYYGKFLYGDHPYGNAVGGDKKSIEAMKAEDLKAFYNTYFTTKRGAIVVVGDFQTVEMKAAITKAFQDWKTDKTAPKPLAAPTLAFDKPRVLLINKEDARETTFYIGGKGIKKNNPDYVAIQVINTVLGGRFTSWLNDELRVNSGLSYGANSRFAAKKETGFFMVSSFTKSATTIEAIDLAVKVLDSLQNKGIDEKTLLSAKNYIKGGFPPGYETPEQLAGLLSEMFIFGYDERFINNFESSVNALTVEKTKEIIKTYFPKNNLQFVMVGKASDIKEKVAKYGAVTEKNIKDDGF